MKKTDWFPADVKPIHRGVYETEFAMAFAGIRRGYSLWDGHKWWNQFCEPKLAVLRGDANDAIQRKEWRGLTKPATTDRQ